MRGLFPFEGLLCTMLPLALLLGIVRQGVRRGLRIDQALCDAASIGDVPWINRLLADGVSPDSADEDGATALMSAAFAAQAKAVATLLHAGADPDLQDSSGLTALMNAVISAGEMDLEGATAVFERIVSLLLDAGADPDLRDEDGCTALDHARSYGQTELVVLLEKEKEDR
jgi:ankyrin repeat protein